ncbi:2381_t:CDS:2, partial [Ambispora gerdemannii]
PQVAGTIPFKFNNHELGLQRLLINGMWTLSYRWEDHSQIRQSCHDTPEPAITKNGGAMLRTINCGNIVRV